MPVFDFFTRLANMAEKSWHEYTNDITHHALSQMPQMAQKIFIIELICVSQTPICT